MGKRDAEQRSFSQQTRILVEQQRGVLANVVQKLEERLGQKAEQVTESCAKELVDEKQMAAQLWLRENEGWLTGIDTQLARRLMTVVTERYDGIGHLERVQHTIPINDPKFRAQLVDTTTFFHRIFLDDIGCELSDDPIIGGVAIRGDDPLAREIARHVLQHIASENTVSESVLRRMVNDTKLDIEREVQSAGRKAVRILNLTKIHPDILHLVGRLKYRLSYSQNQWKHAIEVGYLAGMLAEELGLDPVLARRGGLLHDIGKAMTHEREGSHAVLGAEVARRSGELEVVANCIGAHHADEPAQSALAYVVTAADAISGARPGARRESHGAYVTRMQAIQEIASRTKGVQRVDVMHAGREVRVLVADEDMSNLQDREQMSSDADLHPLAQAIARQLEEELAFPGQIKVTAIRETKAVAIAH